MLQRNKCAYRAVNSRVNLKISHRDTDDEVKLRIMAVKHGAVGEFISDQEDWVSYTERLVQRYFVANQYLLSGE